VNAGSFANKQRDRPKITSAQTSSYISTYTAPTLMFLSAEKRSHHRFHMSHPQSLTDVTCPKKAPISEALTYRLNLHSYYLRTAPSLERELFQLVKVEEGHMLMIARQGQRSSANEKCVNAMNCMLKDLQNKLQFMELSYEKMIHLMDRRVGFMDLQSRRKLSCQRQREN